VTDSRCLDLGQHLMMVRHRVRRNPSPATKYWTADEHMRTPTHWKHQLQTWPEFCTICLSSDTVSAAKKIERLKDRGPKNNNNNNSNYGPISCFPNKWQNFPPKIFNTPLREFWNCDGTLKLEWCPTRMSRKSDNMSTTDAATPAP